MLLFCGKAQNQQLLDISRRVYYQICFAASCRILGTSIRSHRSADVGIEKVIRIFICPICAQRRQQAPVQRTRSNICIRQYQQNRRSCCANRRWAGGQTPTRHIDVGHWDRSQSCDEKLAQTAHRGHSSSSWGQVRTRKRRVTVGDELKRLWLGLLQYSTVALVS